MIRSIAGLELVTVERERVECNCEGSGRNRVCKALPKSMLESVPRQKVCRALALISRDFNHFPACSPPCKVCFGSG